MLPNLGHCEVACESPGSAKKHENAVLTLAVNALNVRVNNSLARLGSNDLRKIELIRKLLFVSY
jgi:hypothetical protein